VLTAAGTAADGAISANVAALTKGVLRAFGATELLGHFAAELVGQHADEPLDAFLWLKRVGDAWLGTTGILAAVRTVGMSLPCLSAVPWRHPSRPCSSRRHCTGT
jgi:hypothetical protein